MRSQRDDREDVSYYSTLNNNNAIGNEYLLHINHLALVSRRIWKCI